MARDGLSRPYADPALRRSPRLYASVLKRLREASLVAWGVECKVSVGIFAAYKKSGKLRVIIDSRISSCWFDDSDAVHLASGSSFASIQAGSQDPICVGGVDVANAFYNAALPKGLQEFFGLPRIRAGQVGVSEVNGAPVAPNTYIAPLFTAIPMGWKLSLWPMQRALEILSRRAPGIEEANALFDRRPAPPLTPLIHTECVDNFVGFSQCQRAAGDAARAVSSELTRARFPAHPVEGTRGGATLGWTFSDDSAEVGVNPTTCWKLRLGFQEFARRKYASGKTVEILVSHFTTRALIRRELLCVFNAAYSFIEHAGDSAVPFWPSVKREFTWASHLIVLASRDLSAPWASEVSVVDASSWGMGACVQDLDHRVVADLGKLNERW
ncbi:unnamed protein product, partial [Prorocentrum cordatum]